MNLYSSNVKSRETECPACYSNNFIWIGEIPQQMNTFTWNKLSFCCLRTNLMQCKDCNLYFKWSRFSKEQLDAFYQNVNPETWQYALRDRKDWRIAKDWINKTINEGSILDIGCWDGEFLESLEGTWRRFEIEINPVSANKALAKGIEIIVQNISEMESLSIKFNVTTAFDLIEHVEYPLNFIASMAKITKNNGFIIISSGNIDAMTWKLSGSRYWYCSLPEHISFTNIAWYKFAANKLDLEIQYTEKFSHLSKHSAAQKILDSVKNVTYLVVPVFFTKLRKIKHRYINRNNSQVIYNYPPSWISSKDHLIIILRKKQ